jgi:hypothetical protein
MADETTVQVVSKTDAVFWMDGEGRWHNAHGPFENPKITAYFHSCIQKDDGGFFLQQEREGVLEKVYFRAADTAYFVFRVEMADPVRLTLNTGRTLDLDPSRLLVANDRLYLEGDDARIKFTAAAAMKLAACFEEGDAGVFCNLNGVRTLIREV